MPESLATIADFVRYAYSRLNVGQVYFGHGTDNSRDEALYLVMQTLNLPWDYATEHWSCLLSTKEKNHLIENIKTRVEQRVPLAYLTKQAWFCGHQFYVDERVLIPRSPIGELIGKQFKPWRTGSELTHILDLCAGSGCIGIACALEFEDVQVDLLDISEAALAVAKINVDKFNLGQRIHLICSDVFASLSSEKEGSYDIIASNPPYVNASDYASMPEEYRKEPSIGLVAGDDGLMIARRLLSEGAKYLKDDGIMIVEVGNSQESLEAAYPDFPFTWVEFEQGGHGVFIIHASELKSRAW